MKLGMQVGLGPGHILLDRDPSPPPQRGTAVQFLAHISCDQMAAWIMMSLAMELGLGPGDIVIDADPAPPFPKGGKRTDGIGRTVLQTVAQKLFCADTQCTSGFCQ